MKGMFLDLFEYNFHSNQKLVEMFMHFPEQTPPRSVALINHIINAHQIWNARILTQETFETWQINPLEELEDLHHMNHFKTIDILENSDLNMKFSYQNSKGEFFLNTVQEVLFHVINHSTYHRGQIALLFREAGLEPIPTDYIFYKR